jgi:hypothetical protein
MYCAAFSEGNGIVCFYYLILKTTTFGLFELFLVSKRLRNWSQKVLRLYPDEAKTRYCYIGIEYGRRQTFRCQSKARMRFVPAFQHPDDFLPTGVSNIDF